MNDPTIWDRLWAFILAAAAYLTGEVGRIYVAGALGGLVRWYSIEGKRRLWGGVAAAIGGVLAAQYLTPVFAGILGWIGISLGSDADVERTLAFISGMFGMTGVKLVFAVVQAEMEVRLRRAAQGEGGGSDDE